MTHFSRKLTIGATLALSLLAGSTLSASAAGETVAFLMPDQGSTRYEEHDARASLPKWPNFAPIAR